MKKFLTTNGKIVLVDEEDFAKFGGYRWWSSVYSVQRSVWLKEKPKTLRLAREIVGATIGQIVDHINGNILDNRKSNLRICTIKDNSRNRKKLPNSSSIYKGVSPNRSNWRADIWVGKSVYLGTFKAELDAAKVYDKAAKQYFGDFACLNFEGLRQPKK